MSIVYEYLAYNDFIERARIVKMRQNSFFHPIHYFTLHAISPIDRQVITYAYVTVEVVEPRSPIKVLVTAMKIKSEMEKGEFDKWSEQKVAEHEKAIVEKLKRDLNTQNVKWGVYCRELADIREFRTLSEVFTLKELKGGDKNDNSNGNS